MAINAAEELSTAIGRALPDACVIIDAPTHESGHWWIDITRGDRKATVEWRPKQGFGVGLGPGGYGEGPDIVDSTVDAATRHVVNYLLSGNSAAATESTVLVASGDLPWRSAIGEHLRLHRVRSDAVATLSEAYKHLMNQTYRVVVIDLAAAEPSGAYRDFRHLIARIDSVVVTMATSDHVAAFEDPFELVMHKRIGTEYVASVIEGLVAAAATGRLPGTHSESV